MQDSNKKKENLVDLDLSRIEPTSDFKIKKKSLKEGTNLDLSFILNELEDDVEVCFIIIWYCC